MRNSLTHGYGGLKVSCRVWDLMFEDEVPSMFASAWDSLLFCSASGFVLFSCVSLSVLVDLNNVTWK